MTHYHPSIETLTDYAAGALPLAHSLCVSTHSEQCPECQKQLMKLETLGAELFEQNTMPSQPLNYLKDQFFATLQRELPKPEQANMNIETPQKKTWQGKDNNGYLIPQSLRQFINEGYNELSWVRLSPSFKIATLHNEQGGAQIALTRVKPGAHMPTHTHTGDEITLVLEGAFSDETGIYRKGDFICRDARHKHKPIVTKDAECICLTVLDAPIEFTGWFARLLNPILRRYHPHTSL